MNEDEEIYNLAKGLQNSNVSEVAKIAKAYVGLYETLGLHLPTDMHPEDLSEEDYNYGEGV
jgi:hypothetical protein